MFYADGLIEQWGIIDAGSYSADTNIQTTFSILFANTPAISFLIDASALADNSSYFLETHGVTTSNFSWRSPNVSGTCNIHYKAVGF